MKFKLNRGKSIKLGDKEIPISTTDGWTDIPDDEIIEALSNAGKKHGQPDWSQEDETDPGYIKNKSLSIPTLEEIQITKVQTDANGSLMITTKWQLDPSTYTYSLKIDGDMFRDLPYTTGAYGSFTIGDIDSIGVLLNNTGYGSRTHDIYWDTKIFPNGIHEIQLYYNALMRLPDEATPAGLVEWLGKNPSDYANSGPFVHEYSPVLSLTTNQTAYNYIDAEDYNIRENLIYFLSSTAKQQTLIRNIRVSRTGSSPTIYPIKICEGDTYRNMSASDVPYSGVMIVGSPWIEGRVDGGYALLNPRNPMFDYFILKSSTKGSSKKFKITVDDAGTLSATEVTG